MSASATLHPQEATVPKPAMSSLHPPPPSSSSPSPSPSPLFPVPPAASSPPPSSSPAPSEGDVDVDSEAAAIDAALSNVMDDDSDFEPPTSFLPPNDADDADYVPPTTPTALTAPPNSKRRKDRSSTPKPPPVDPSIARATGAKLLDELLAKAAAYMSRTAVGAELAVQPMSTSRASRGSKKGGGPGARMSEAEEDDALLHALEDEAERSSTFAPLTEQPSCITGKMRGYQLEGLNWMIKLYDSGVSGILADEMGLGKTLQSISLLAYLNQVRHVRGPHLVLTPLSTLGNWHREFTRWAPQLRVLRFHGTKEERAEMIARGDLRMRKHDILLTSYEMAIREKTVINKQHYHFLIVDEAHRLKNENSLLSVIVRYFSSKYRLLLTGTPLQNNLHELWALLNFLLPDLFSSAGDFDAIFSDAETDSDSDRGATLLQSLHRLLRPFMLRRLKTQVETDLPPKKISLIYTGLSEIQRKLYKQILEKDVEALMGTIKERGRLMNIVMQLRKVADHPFLFAGVEDPNAPLHGDHLVTTCGKMIILDRLLAHLKARGSRVLIFSQMTRMLDILEDFLVWRAYPYNRIDGNTSQADREEAMRVFNEDNSQKFVFILSTRAGGLGINLVTADTVILYDSDWSATPCTAQRTDIAYPLPHCLISSSFPPFCPLCRNPQMDLQAMDRAHRIGQKKQVNVLRLICEDTVEVQMLKRAEIKLHLDAMVIQQGRVQSGRTTKAGAMTTEDLTKMIRYGADKIFRQTESSVSDSDIINILERGEQKAKELDSDLKAHVNLMDLTFDGKQVEEASLLPEDPNESNLTPEELEMHRVTIMADALGKRQRKTASYSDDAYYRDVMKAGGRVVKTLMTKPVRLPRMSEHQLYDRKRLEELSDKEVKYYWKYYHSATPPALRGLSEEEGKEMERLLEDGYPDWSYADFQSFVKACKRHGRYAIDKIVATMASKGKSREQVTAYHADFFRKAGTAMKGGPALLDKIERAEARVARFTEMEELLDKVTRTHTTAQSTAQHSTARHTRLTITIPRPLRCLLTVAVLFSAAAVSLPLPHTPRCAARLSFALLAPEPRQRVHAGGGPLPAVAVQRGRLRRVEEDAAPSGTRRRVRTRLLPPQQNGPGDRPQSQPPAQRDTEIQRPGAQKDQEQRREEEGGGSSDCVSGSGREGEGGSGRVGHGGWKERWRWKEEERSEQRSLL